MNKYKSIYAPGKELNALQYICELLCQKKAAFDKVQLPLRFWESMPKWNTFFKKNLRMVSKLLTKYDAKAIISVLRSPKFGRRYSIFTEFAENLMIIEQKKIDLEKASQQVNIVRATKNEKPRTRNLKKSVLEALDEFDSGTN